VNAPSDSGQERWKLRRIDESDHRSARLSEFEPLSPFEREGSRDGTRLTGKHVIWSNSRLVPVRLSADNRKQQLNSGPNGNDVPHDG
jgi:hypothetical protein